MKQTAHELADLLPPAVVVLLGLPRRPPAHDSPWASYQYGLASRRLTTSWTHSFRNAWGLLPRILLAKVFHNASVPSVSHVLLSQKPSRTVPFDQPILTGALEQLRSLHLGLEVFGTGPVFTDLSLFKSSEIRLEEDDHPDASLTVDLTLTQDAKRFLPLSISHLRQLSQFESPEAFDLGLFLSLASVSVQKLTPLSLGDLGHLLALHASELTPLLYQFREKIPLKVSWNATTLYLPAAPSSLG